MSEAIIKLLKGAGYKESIFEEASKEGFDVNKAIQDNNNAQKEHWTSIVRNEIEPDLKESIKKERDGYWLNLTNHEIKKHGVPMSEFEEKPLHEKIKALASFKEKSTSKNAGDEVRILQEKNIELSNNLKDWEERFESKVSEVVKGEQQKTTAKLVDIERIKKFNSIPAEKILGKKHSDGIMLAVKAYQDQKYDLGLDENGQIIPFEKGTQKRVQGKNGDGRDYFVTYEDLMLSSLKELNMLVESNGGSGSGQQGKTTSTDQTKKSQRIIEMERRIQEANAQG